MIVDGIDESWGFADPAQVKAQGIHVVSMYLSRDPSKNMTAAKIKAYHEAGIGVLINWESNAGDPLLGAAKGQENANEAVRQLHAVEAEVGYKPKNTLAIYFSCDVQVPVEQLQVVAGYYRATKLICQAARLVNAVYGEFDVVEYLASHGITQAEWQTLAWSGGKVSQYADFYQFQINQKLAGTDVDFDKILHPRQMHAWWPPGHVYDAPFPAPSPVTPAVPITPERPVATNPTDRTLTDADIEAIWAHKLVRIGPKGEKWGRAAGDRLVDLAIIRDGVKAIAAKLGVKFE